jgi:hypothetical protein
MLCMTEDPGEHNKSLTITILDIIHCQVFYSKHNDSDTELCLCLQVEPTHLAQ